MRSNDGVSDRITFTQLNFDSLTKRWKHFCENDLLVPYWRISIFLYISPTLQKRFLSIMQILCTHFVRFSLVNVCVHFKTSHSFTEENLAPFFNEVQSRVHFGRNDTLFKCISKIQKLRLIFNRWPPVSRQIHCAHQKWG